MIGYASGAFDIFHVGHLNLLRRSRLLCDCLIAGVASDAAMISWRGRAPVRSETERMSVIESVRYVDGVYLDGSVANKREAWNDLRFDILFKGDDWRGVAKGNRLEKDMAAVGVRVVYLPYTAATSSSILRLAIEEQGQG